GDASDPRGLRIMGKAPYRCTCADENEHERDQQSRAPAHAFAGPVHFGSGLSHSLAARASSASSFGRSAVSTVRQPSPTASAAASLIAATLIVLRSRTSSANRRPARGEWISATLSFTALRSGASGLAR